MKEMVKNAEVLLKQVSALNKKHEEIARITGRKFNVFSILGVESRETSTHSAFLVELLNPDGSHGQGSIFLDLFITVLDKKGIRLPSNQKKQLEEKIDLGSCSVEKEKHLGRINKEKTKGGRADILIRGSKGTICIENKIYAGDQENQLIRYKEKYGANGLILYLTLYGSKATEWSTKSGENKLDAGKDYFRISYKKDILEWLINCQKETVDIPIVRDVIGQYIYLIKKLTRQSMNDTQKKEFFELITTGENADAILQVNDGLDSFIKEVKRKLVLVKNRLNPSQLSNYKSSEIWDKMAQTKKLQSVLTVKLTPIHAVTGIELKIRLSPHGWRIELWKLSGLILRNPEKKGTGNQHEEYAVFKTFKGFGTSTSDIIDAAKKAVEELHPPIVGQQ